MHWQTTLVTRRIGPLAAQVRAGRFPLVSSGVVSLPEATLGFATGVLVRDPDGHVMQLVAP